MSIQSNFPSIKPSLLLDFANTKKLDSRVTFTRSTTATYYDGVTTAKAEENLLLQSQTFENASWSDNATAITRTANTTTAPDGTTTADSAVGDGTTAIHYFGQLVTIAASTNYVFSIYVKANGLNFVQFFLSAGTSYANFDVTSGAGATGTAVGFSSLAIQDAGNGWYRCSFLINEGSARNGIYIALSNSASAARGPSFSTSGGLFLWGAQLEQRSSVTAYTATTTQAITNYIPVLQTAASGVPRFDHNPTTDESLGLLIEEQRTNLFTYSAQFDNAAWTKTLASVTANAAVSPDGTTTADKIVEDTSTNIHGVRQDVATSAVTYGFSVYVKPDGRNWCYLYNSTTNAYVYFNISSGVVGTALSATGSISSAGNGWYRCTIITTATAATNAWRIYLATADGVGSYTGDGFSGILVWGAQLEAGAFATSYIPTVASTVTRNADQASMTGTNFSGWFSADQGTLYAEASQPTIFASSRTVASINSTTTTSYFNIYRQSAGAVNGFTSPSNTVLTTSRNAVANTAWKASLSWQSGTVYFTAGGDAVVNAAYTTYLPSLNTFEIGNVGTGGAQNFNGQIRKIAYYPLRVTNAQLQALTS